MILQAFFAEGKPLMKPLYRADSTSILLQLPQDQLFRDRIPQLTASNVDIQTVFKHVRDDALSKKMKVVGYFLQEMALVSSDEYIPGLKDEGMPKKPLEQATEAIVPSVKKSLHIFRLTISLENLKEQQIMNDVKRDLMNASAIPPEEAQSYSVVIAERRLQARVHNTFKEIGKPLIVNLLPEEGSLTAGADLTIEEFRADKAMALVF